MVKFVPQWNHLPKYVQQDLKNWKNWFLQNQNKGELRLTLLNLYTKMKGLDLWKFVEKPTGKSMEGALEFTANVQGLKKALRTRDDFTTPEPSQLIWSSREKRASGSIHFKHDHWHKTNKEVQAHIDPHGLLLSSDLWWLLFPVPLGQMITHGVTEKKYKDVRGIRDLLLDQGWDPTPLLGVSSKTFQQVRARIPMRNRQAWLRSYYRANPLAAQQARKEARTIINYAHKHLPYSRRGGISIQSRNKPFSPLSSSSITQQTFGKSKFGRSLYDKGQMIPRNRADPYPREVFKIPMRNRQAWLRSYYRANPLAAQQARKEARTIINYAHKHLPFR